MAFSTGHKPVASYMSTMLMGDVADLPKPIRPKTASAVLRRRNGETTEIVKSRAKRPKVNRWK